MKIFLKDNRVLCNIEYQKGDSRRNDIFLTYSSVEGYFNGFYEKSLQLNTSGTPLDLYKRVCRMIERAEQVHSEDKPIIIDEQVYEFRNLLKPIAEEIYSREESKKEAEAKAWIECQEKEKTYKKAQENGCFGNCASCVRNGYEDGYDCKALAKTLRIKNKPLYDYKTGMHYMFNYIPVPDEACPLRSAYEEYDAYIKANKTTKKEEEKWII